MGIGNRIKSAVTKVTNRSKEELSTSGQFANYLSGSMNLRNGEFISDLLGDDRNTPHNEMREGWRMLQNDIQVAQSVSKKSLMMLGREITVNSDDEETREYFNQEVIPRFKQAAITAAKHSVGVGNGYIEVVRGDETSIPVDFEPINRPHKVYPQYSKDGFDITGYVLESFKETNTEAETYSVMVSERSNKRIKGKRFDENEIIHLRVGSGAMPKMGRSDFLSGIDDYKIKRELKRFEGISARHKMTPRKAFVFNEGTESTGIDEPGDTAASDIRREREQELNNLDVDENPVFHDIELEINDYDYNPQMPQANDVINSLTKDLTSPLPEFASNHSDGPRTPSRQPMNLLQMELSGARLEWEAEINPFFQEIAEARGLDPNVTIEFGDFTFPTRDEKTTEVIKMFQNNILTLGQAVQRLPFEVDVPTEYEDKYNFELDTGGNPFDSLQQKLDDIENVDKKEIQDLIGNSDE